MSIPYMPSNLNTKTPTTVTTTTTTTTTTNTATTNQYNNNQYSSNSNSNNTTTTNSSKNKKENVSFDTIYLQELLNNLENKSIRQISYYMQFHRESNSEEIHIIWKEKYDSVHSQLLEEIGSNENTNNTNTNKIEELKQLRLHLLYVYHDIIVNSARKSKMEYIKVFSESLSDIVMKYKEVEATNTTNININNTTNYLNSLLALINYWETKFIYSSTFTKFIKNILLEGNKECIKDNKDTTTITYITTTNTNENPENTIKEGIEIMQIDDDTQEEATTTNNLNNQTFKQLNYISKFPFPKNLFELDTDEESIKLMNSRIDKEKINTLARKVIEQQDKSDYYKPNQNESDYLNTSKASLIKLREFLIKDIAKREGFLESLSGFVNEEKDKYYEIVNN